MARSTFFTMTDAWAEVCLSQDVTQSKRKSVSGFRGGNSAKWACSQAKPQGIEGRQGGYALIGVMVGVIIFFGGILGVADLHSQAIRLNHDSEQRSHAIWLAKDVAERLKSNIGKTGEYVTALGAITDLTTWCVATKSCDGTDTCSESEFVTYDTEEFTCRNDNFSRLVSPDLDIVCAGTCAFGDEVTITVSWDGREAVRQEVDLVFIRH